MKLISDSNAATGKAGALERDSLRRKRKRRATSDDEGSELEVWRREDFGLLLRFVLGLCPQLRELEWGIAGLTMFFVQRWVMNGPKRSTKTLCYACARTVRLFGVLLCGSLDTDARFGVKVS